AERFSIVAVGNGDLGKPVRKVFRKSERRVSGKDDAVSGACEARAEFLEALLARILGELSDEVGKFLARRLVAFEADLLSKQKRAMHKGAVHEARRERFQIVETNVSGFEPPRKIKGNARNG